MTLESKTTIMTRIDLTNNQKSPMPFEKLVLLLCIKKERKSLSTTPQNLKRRNNTIKEVVTIILSPMVTAMAELTQ